MSDVRLGFEVGSGSPVDIPVRHMAICGQTQEAGKTTALEALIARSGRRALTFITKRGEGSFTEARRIDPYFREQADWQFVASVLEASRGEKLKFERAWIIRASKGARTLADVHANVRKAMETAKGLAGDVYLTLDAYLDVVVPAIARVQWASTVHLEPGVNAMDLTALPSELQHLVIKSALDWVLDKAHETVIVIPEAWKFIPQGRGTPVKLSAAAYIRQGAALKNYLWLDSQDLGGIEKEILRSVPIWLLGVQREANEIKRTLDNIPAGVSKPSKADVATLELGQFFACWKSHAIRTYVQPNWMPPSTAIEIAAGRLDVSTAWRTYGRPNEPRPPAREWDGLYVDDETGRVHRFQGAENWPHQEETVNETEARALRDENERLKTQNAELLRRIEALEARHGIQTGDRAADQSRDSERRAGTGDRDGAAPAHAGSPRLGRGGPGDGSAGQAGAGAARTFTPQETFDNEALYQAFKARLIAEAQQDPVLLAIAASRTELEVRRARKTINADEDSLTGRLAILLAEGFFDGDGRTSKAAQDELACRGKDPGPKNMPRELRQLAEKGFLRVETGYDEKSRERTLYRAIAGMKVHIIEAA